VVEVLKECELMLMCLVLYFVCFVLFLYLLVYRGWECLYVVVGLVLYDIMGGVCSVLW